MWIKSGAQMSAFDWCIKTRYICPQHWDGTQQVDFEYLKPECVTSPSVYMQRSKGFCAVLSFHSIPERPQTMFSSVLHKCRYRSLLSISWSCLFKAGVCIKKKSEGIRMTASARVAGRVRRSLGFTSRWTRAEWRSSWIRVWETRCGRLSLWEGPEFANIYTKNLTSRENRRQVTHTAIKETH